MDAELEEWVPAHYQARQRYLELAVFPEDTDIPLSTLQIYWQGTGGLHEDEVEKLCLHLSDLSLVLPCKPEQATTRPISVISLCLRPFFPMPKSDNEGNKQMMATKQADDD